MGSLAGFKYKEIMRRLKKAGFEFDRSAKGSHEIWWNPITRARTTVPNHPGDIPAAFTDEYSDILTLVSHTHLLSQAIQAHFYRKQARYRCRGQTEGS